MLSDTLQRHLATSQHQISTTPACPPSCSAAWLRCHTPATRRLPHACHTTPATPVALPQADAKLAEKDESLALVEFVAAPWLLPQRCRSLNYTEVHDMDMLLTLRAAPWPGGPAGNFTKAITVLLFSKSIAAMFQNTRELAVGG